MSPPHQHESRLGVVGPPARLEPVFRYAPGGFLPVHLQDCLDNRYRVIHKLGSGGFATVWLCRDTTDTAVHRYVAVKVIIASASGPECPEIKTSALISAAITQCPESSRRLLGVPLRHFSIAGPAGRHDALVYPVLGPHVSQLGHLVRPGENRGAGSTLRKLCHQVLEAVGVLHCKDICHGDIRPENILTRVSGLNGLPEKEVLDFLGEPQTTKVVDHSQTPRRSRSRPAPDYLVYPVNWSQILAKKKATVHTQDSICLIDLGEAFITTGPPPKVLGIPVVYRAPEALLDGQITIGCDTWALACTIFEIRTGRQLFACFDNDPDEYLYKVCRILGKLPEPWWSTKWESRKDYFEDAATVEGLVTMTGGEAEAPSGTDYAEPRSLKAAVLLGYICDNETVHEVIKEKISEEEAVLLADLLGSMLRWRPEDRPAVGKLLDHPWFKF